MPLIPIIRVDPFRDFQNAIKKASDILLSGGLVAYPTESFYGLAVDSTNENAIRRLFLLKQRSPGRPLLILIPSIEVLDRYVAHIPPIAHQLIDEFWPGALTLVFEAGPKVSPLLTAGTDKIGIRLSPHPVATALAQAIGAPITGTSANISGKPACRNAGEVSGSFKEWVDLILDGGATTGKIGSTVLDITVDPPKILREGMVQKSALEKYISA
jgi:L-threonylcarbamoyladenylate synthase